MTIFLIRHGETEGNRTGVVQLPDVPLNERGIAQAEKMAARLADEPISHILSSDLLRARMTAEILARLLDLELELEPLLQERNFGDLRGRPYASFDFDPMALDYVPPGGESWEVFHARAAKAWQRIADAAEQAKGLAVVTHGLMCHALSHEHLLLEAPHAPPARWGNTAVTVIEKRSPWRVRVLNCTRHLEGAVTDGSATGSGF